MAAKYSAAERKNTAFSFIFIFLTIYSYLIGRRHKLNVINTKECLSFVLSIFGLLSLLLEISNIFFFFSRYFFGFWLFLFFMFSTSLILSFSFVIYSLFTAVDNPELCRVIPSIPPTSSSLFLSLSIFYLTFSFSFSFLLFIFFLIFRDFPSFYFYIRICLSIYFFLFYKHKYVGNSVIVCCYVATSARLGCVGLKAAVSVYRLGYFYKNIWRTPLLLLLMLELPDESARNISLSSVGHWCNSLVRRGRHLHHRLLSSFLFSLALFVI